ncbi:hypothetical protein AVEN_224459-1 [Araneus ventricosus]|uniref:DDE Tnp4 domain-containing protein n=1 Tax=Araneus ventricosus TaxID=182803 RepID=A0A4Y2RHH0_ARAVE|nr:hypothetical protein AVEN_224459-1 [Araneus ventricosus]
MKRAATPSSSSTPSPKRLSMQGVSSSFTVDSTPPHHYPLGEGNYRLLSLAQLGQSFPLCHKKPTNQLKLKLRFPIARSHREPLVNDKIQTLKLTGKDLGRARKQPLSVESGMFTFFLRGTAFVQLAGFGHGRVPFRYLGSGCTFTDLHYAFRIGISTLRKIIKDVCKAIWTIMREECIPELFKEKFDSMALFSKSDANFPHCLGAVDGKHIRIICPMNSGSMFFNYKDYYSVVLMAVADATYRFVYLKVGSFGRDCDSTIFKQSTILNAIIKKTRCNYQKKNLPGSESPKIPYFFVGDEAFGLHKHLLRPYSGTRLTLDKRIFNYRLCRARRCVECAFGTLSNKWRIFHRPINVDVDFAVDIVKTCIVLHSGTGFLVRLLRQ